MKKLREGYTTGSCAAAASLACVLWQTTGNMPEQIELETPAGKILHLSVQNCENYHQFACGIIKDSGDDPDCTNHCLVIAHVEIFSYDGDILFQAGEGIGTVTKKGLKIPVGQPAINSVPRQMISKAIRSVIGNKAASVCISIPNGKEIAVRTFNPRLGIVNGLSILGTTGIVRPMSEEAVRESLRAALSVCRAEYGSACAFVTGYQGETYLKKQYQKHAIIVCSNYLGYLLDCAEEMQFTHILLAGQTGKLTKPAASIMYLHSHTAGGQREVVCTHAALAGANTTQIQALYTCQTTAHMQELLTDYHLSEIVWHSIAEAGVQNCEQRTHQKIQIAMLLLGQHHELLARTKYTDSVLKEWCKWQTKTN